VKLNLEEEHGIFTVVEESGLVVGRALTKKDGEDIIEYINALRGDGLRERLLSEITDAVENAFDAGA